MTAERWGQIERLYHSALEREAGERESFLDRACAGDDELRREIASLLAHDGLADSFIAAPALADAAQLIAGASLMENTATQRDAPAVAREIGSYKLQTLDRKSTRLNSSHLGISYAVFCLKKKK